MSAERDSSMFRAVNMNSWRADCDFRELEQAKVPDHAGGYNCAVGAGVEVVL